MNGTLAKTIKIDYDSLNLDLSKPEEESDNICHADRIDETDACRISGSTVTAQSFNVPSSSTLCNAEASNSSLNLNFHNIKREFEDSAIDLNNFIAIVEPKIASDEFSEPYSLSIISLLDHNYVAVEYMQIKVEEDEYCRSTFLENVNTVENANSCKIIIEKKKKKMENKIDGRYFMPTTKPSPQSSFNIKRVKVEANEKASATENVPNSSEVDLYKPLRDERGRFKVIKLTAKTINSINNANQITRYKHREALCHLCGKMYKLKERYRHTISHLTNIEWLFKCLLCGNTSLYKEYFHTHMLHGHGMSFRSLECGVHYDEQESLYEREIERVRCAAFPDEVKLNKRLRCHLCDSDVLRRLQHKHALKHLADVTHVGEWMFSCLFCNNFRSNHRWKMRNHLIDRHGLKGTEQEDVHFSQSAKFKKEINRVQLLAFPKADKPVNVNSVQCQLCNTNVLESNRYSHVFKHVSEKTGIKWVYKCLVCDSYQTTYRTDLRKHLIDLHKVKCALQEDVHYISQMSKFKEEISRLRLIAFPSQVVRSKYTPGLQKCKLCGKSVRVTKASHAQIHLPETHNIRWLYKCLLCNDLKTLHKCSVLTHLLLVHKITRPRSKVGKHYMSRIPEFAEQVAQVRKMAFPPNQERVPEQPEVPTQKCKLCSKIVPAVKKSRHARIHLSETHGITWLFKCLICNDYQTMHSPNVSNHVAFKHNVKLSDVKLGKHYISQVSKCTKQLAEACLVAFPPPVE